MRKLIFGNDTEVAVFNGIGLICHGEIVCVLSEFAKLKNF